MQAKEKIFFTRIWHWKSNKSNGQAELTGVPEKVSGLYHRCYNRRLVIIDNSGRTEKTIIEKKHVFAISYTALGKGPSIPDFPDFLWTITEDNHIIFSEGNSFTASTLMVLLKKKGA